jgi:hypothetical protein
MPAISLGLLAMLAAASHQTPHATSRTGESKLVRNLPQYLARSRPTWPKDPEFEKGSIVMESARSLAVAFMGPAAVAFGSDSAFATLPDLYEDCTNWPYRHFFVGRDTITFTYGNSPEACSESPGMIFRDSRGALERANLTPLFGWNVDAIWLTPHYLVFAVTGQGESVLPQFVRIVCWQLETGRWFTGPSRNYLMHRAGFDLPELLPDWFTSHAYEFDGAVVLRGQKRALALWPEQRAWSLVDARTGSPVPAASGATFRRVVSTPNQRIGAALTNEIKSIFVRAYDEANRDVVTFTIVDMIQSPCIARRYQYAVTATAKGRDRAPGHAERGWTRDLIGVCLLDSSLTHVVKAFPPFPAHGCVAYFDLNAAPDSIAVWKEDEMYATFGGRFAYSCAP